MSDTVEERTDEGRRVVNAPLRPPWSQQGLLEVFRHRYILSLLVRREIAARYQGSVLGLLWSYVNPLTQFFIYYFVMGILFGRANRVENFAIHVFAGLIIVHFFTETMNAGTRSIVRNKSLVQKMSVPREMFPVASMLVSLFHVGPQVLILLVATFLAGWTPDPWGMFYGVMALLISMCLGSALALMFSAANVFLRDVSNAVSVLSNLVRFGVPMMYPYTLVAVRFHGHTALYLLNPIVEAVLGFQRAFWVGATSNPARTAAIDMPPNMLWLSVRALLISIAVLVVAQSIFSRLERRIPERLLSRADKSIVVRHVSKTFTLRYHRTLKQMSVAMMRQQELSDSFLAVNDVSFSVDQGESIGLMGLNGSGKSTLLKMVNGVMRPDSGKVLTRGRTAGLIATGAGFHPQLSGRDNVYLNAAILGMTEAETRRKFDDIVEFADIGKFLDSPVGHYSSGMFARLGFAVAIHVDADIFLADEVLAVGDRPFKKKCLAKMQEIRDGGTTLFYVSHATGSVRKMCSRVLVLEKGVLAFDGPVDEGIKFLHYDDDESDDPELSDEMADEEMGADI